MNVEPVQYPADQAAREQLVLLKSIRNGVSLIAVMLLVFSAILILAIIGASA